MDGWGDPWAEDETKKHDHVQPVAAAAPRATGVVFGFEDDAGWGVQDDSEAFGDFVDLNGKKEEDAGWHTTKEETSWQSHHSWVDAGPSDNANDHLETSNWDQNTFREPQQEDRNTSNPEEVKEASLPGAKTGDSANIDTEGSDSSTTVDANEHSTTYEHEPAGIDDASSTRTSPSPSSSLDHTEEHVRESPRTSFEEDTGVAHAQEEKVEQSGADVPSQVVTERDEDDDFGDFAEEEEADSTDTAVPYIESESAVTESKEAFTSETDEAGESPSESAPSSPSTKRPIADPSIDLGLINKIFPANELKSDEESLEANPEVISSASSRKAWYRITRPQTLRQYDSGDLDGYVRVHYPGSAIQAEVSKIITQWAKEDRARGHDVFGARAGPMFGWTDSPMTTQPVAPWHQRGVSESTKLETKRAAAQARLETRKGIKRHNTVASASTPIAQFNWSSSPLNPTSAALLQGSSPKSPAEGSRKILPKRDPVPVPSPSSPISQSGRDSISNEPSTSRMVETKPDEVIKEELVRDDFIVSNLSQPDGTDLNPDPTPEIEHATSSKFPPIRGGMQKRITSFGDPSKNARSRMSSTSRERRTSQPQHEVTSDAGAHETSTTSPQEPESKPSGLSNEPADRWSALGNLDTQIITSGAVSFSNGPAIGDDDDWGEMISSPALTSPVVATPQAGADSEPSSSKPAADNADIDFSFFETLPRYTKAPPSHTKTQSLSTLSTGPPPPTEWGNGDERAIFEKSASGTQAKHSRIQSVPTAPFKATVLSDGLPQQAPATLVSGNIRVQTQTTESDDDTVRRFIEGIPDFSFMLK